MTFHLCCTQPQRTFGFRVLDGMGHPSASLQHFTRLWSESRRRTPFKRPKLYFIKAHKVTFSRAFSHTHTHTQRESLPRMLFLLPAKFVPHTHTHKYTDRHMHIYTQWALSFCGWHSSPVQLPLSLSLYRSPANPQSQLREGPFCMRAGFVYATIEFTASLNLCLSFRFRFHCLLLLIAWDLCSEMCGNCSAV